MRELAARVLAQSPRRMVALGPQREHQQHRRVLGEREKLLEQEHRRRVGPVKILEGEHERRRLREPSEELADDLEGSPLECLRRELRGASLGLALERDLEQSAQVRVKLVGLAVEELLQASAQPDANAELGLLGSGADPFAAQQVAERPVRQRLAVRDATALEPRAPFPLRELAQLVEEPGLADAGVSRDDEDTSAAGAKRLERLPAETELARAA